VAKKKKEEKPREYTRRQLSHFQKQKRRQRFIFIGGISIIVAIILIVLLGWFLAEYRPTHRTLIKVNDVEFNTRYFVDLLKIYEVANQNPQLDLDQLLQQISSSLSNGIIQNELIRQAAQPLGITISDEEIRKTLEDAGQPVTDAYIDIMRTQQLEKRLKDEYFGIQVPVSDNQVHMMAMLVEGESLALELQTKLINGDNFTALDEQYAQNYYSKTVNKGDYDWHPAAILKDQLGSQIPIDFAFGADTGALSPPLSDNESYKQFGYWLINVQERLSENETMVQALLLSSQDLAVDIKARLESGDNLSALADEYSQYSPSKEKHGDLGLITKPTTANATTISAAFDGYVFDPLTELGKWSNPISDITFWTQGGYWLVKVIDKENDRKVSDEDRTTLIDKAYSEWINQLWLQYAAGIDTGGLTEEARLWAVERAKKELQSVGG
jgi:parvulin-like peptidyl-prolyl isomerase